MSGLAILLALAALAALFMLQRRVQWLERELAELQRQIAGAAPLAAPVEKPQVARVVLRTAPPLQTPELPDAPPPAPTPPPPPPAPRLNLESLIGGRLPIWIGGAALVLAGFFLVRYSVESGLIGPTARVVLAALFGFALIAASEAARRFPATAEDPRVGQVLAGAGIASLYGTLYMAAALYHLLTPLSGFVAVVLVTAGAMALALRQGPPTAVMALIGGFAAPLVAGFDAAGITPLLVYLALFIAALFGLAIQRGWGWLALAAGVAGFAWINFLAVMLQGRTSDLSAVGAFTMLLAAGASAALPATGTGSRWLRLAPLLAGCLQLVILAPGLDFSALSWSFYLVLAAAGLFLAWRDATYLPGAIAALTLLLVLQALALLQPDRAVAPIAAIVATLLFAVPGHLRATRTSGWVWLALGGTAGPLLVANAIAPELLVPSLWALLALVAAAATAQLAWRLAQESAPAAAATALLFVVGIAQLLPNDWIGLPLAFAIIGLAAWARRLDAPPLFALPAYPYAAALVAATPSIVAMVTQLLASLSGERLTYPLLPPLAPLLQTLALPTAALIAILLDPRQLGRFRHTVGALAIAAAILILHTLAKQPLAIASLPRFVEWGFIERALLSQACLAAAWWLMRGERLPRLARVLLVIGLFRIAWFDLQIMNPVIEPQSVGSIPLFNAAVLHLALAAGWLWTMPQQRYGRPAAMLLTLATLFAAVRQATHGAILTGPVGGTENGGYSVVMLGLALFWLWRGITAAKTDLRFAGLGLLTLVTFKVFLIDAAALDGVLRILSFLALGLALIGIGWAYGRFLATPKPAPVT